MFKKDIPNYKTYSNDDYYMTNAPHSRDFWQEIEAYAAKADNILAVVNKLNDIALLPPTKNWGRAFLIDDLDYVFRKIAARSDEDDIAMLMDAIAVIAEESFIDLSEMNDFLLRYRIGYQLERESLTRSFYWTVRDNIENIVERIDATIEIAQKSELQQTVEHLAQAKKQLENPSDERARKDAVRDCASAMEAAIKDLGEFNDIKQASRNLRNSKQWGLEDIVKDGEAIFNSIHRFYPDVRHGSTEKSTMPLNEAIYWIDRMSVYIGYMIRQQNERSF